MSKKVLFAVVTHIAIGSGLLDIRHNQILVQDVKPEQSCDERSKWILHAENYCILIGCLGTNDFSYKQETIALSNSGQPIHTKLNVLCC